MPSDKDRFRKIQGSLKLHLAAARDVERVLNDACAQLMLYELEVYKMERETLFKAGMCGEKNEDLSARYRGARFELDGTA